MCAEKTQEMEVSPSKEDKVYGSSRYVVTWTVVLMLGMSLEFLARLLGYENNPFSYFHPLIPAFTGILAALIIMSGYFVLVNKKAKLNSLYKRNGVMLVILGVLMLACFFMFKEVIPQIFG